MSGECSRPKPPREPGELHPIADVSTNLLLVGIGLATGLATLAGGSLALRFRDRLPLILGFSAGAVIGVALFDLAPEALALARPMASPSEILAIIGAGFCLYMIVERILRAVADGRSGHLGPASLTVHSLFDGLGVGLAFQVAPAIGVVVAVAVLAHDVADGVNAVTLSLSGGGGSARARGWLFADAAAPLVGIFLTRLFAVAQAPLGLTIACFAGFFLYIGVSAIAARGDQPRSGVGTGLAVAVGMAFIWIVVRLAGP